MSIPNRTAFSETILELAKEDESIFVLCTDSRGSATIGEFANQLPQQFVEVGIAEQNCVGIAAGLSNVGLKPYIVGPACFYSMRSIEQIKVDVAYSRHNVKIVGISGGVSYGALGGSHHSVQDIAVMTAIGDLATLLPADETATREITKLLPQYGTPAYIRLGRGAVPNLYGPEGLFQGEVTFTIGKANVLSQGQDICIIATGEAVFHALEAANLLRTDSIQATVIDMHTLMPFDGDAILKELGDKTPVITVEEHSINGGLGSLVASFLSNQSPRLVEKIAFPNEFLVTGSSKELFDYYGISADNIVKTAKKILNR